MSSVSEEKRITILKGIGVSPGIAIGKAYVLDRLDTKKVSRYRLDDSKLVTREIRRFRKALKESERQLLEIKKKLSDYKGIEALYIIDVHVMILKDRMLINDTIQNIKDKSINAEWALRITIDRYREIFNKVEDDYLRERISDVEYVGQRILRSLVGKKHEVISNIGEDVVIVARDLSPADTAQMKVEKVLGFATDIGGKTSHTAIMAKSIEIPAVVGLEKVVREVKNDDEIIINGISGFVIVNPDPDILRRYKDKKKHYQAIEENLLQYAGLPALTKDNYRVEIGANIEFVEEIPSAVAHGADGIGLFRTEYLYINREQLPTEEEHFLSYKSVIEGRGIKGSTIRTFDLGGDKFFSDPRLPREMNPQMGLRAIRFCLKEIELFKVQLRAILRASVYGKTKVLFPMISGVGEFRDVKKIFNEVKDNLLAEGIPVAKDIEVGIMVEIPSAVMVADELAREADFFSIGTNDLIQYTLAIDRINEQVSYLYEPLHPAVLRLIKRIVDAGHKAGIKVAMCGEMAGEPAYTIILLGFELDELSMNPLAIPRVKKIIRESSLWESKELLRKVMTFSTAAETEEFVRNYMTQRFPEDFPINEQ
ncbi:MAG: phosphoenolpyruvate--protein phosphotransferase [Syntrophales bacterium]|nr:phosphoenolpyruvate--protein phosphotransferase [Syntrophales bacterium]